MSTKNQTHSELVQEYIHDYHDVYNAMMQVKQVNPYADTSRFTEQMRKLVSLITIHQTLAEVSYDSRE